MLITSAIGGPIHSGFQKFFGLEFNLGRNEYLPDTGVSPQPPPKRDRSVPARRPR